MTANFRKRCAWAEGVGDFYIKYHDAEWGEPVHDDRKHFEFLILEGAQAGLSWATVLKKREAYRKAFARFEPAWVARFTEKKIVTLLKNPGIIRNRLKVQAVIDNAKRVVTLRESHGGFAGWLAAHHPRNHAAWTKLFRAQFKFMGGEIVNEFLMCIGYLPGAHREDCPAYRRVAKARPPWMRVDPKVFKSR